MTEEDYLKFKKNYHLFRDCEWCYVLNTTIDMVRKAKVRMQEEERMKIILADNVCEQKKK